MCVAAPLYSSIIPQLTFTSLFISKFFIILSFHNFFSSNNFDITDFCFSFSSISSLLDSFVVEKILLTQCPAFIYIFFIIQIKILVAPFFNKAK